MDITAEGIAAGIIAAILRKGAGVRTDLSGRMEPSFECAFVLGIDAHPSGWDIDAVHLVLRIIGKPPADFGPWFINHEVQGVGIEPPAVAEMQGHSGPGESASHDRDRQDDRPVSFSDRHGHLLG